MEQSNQSKKVLLSVIGVAILVVAVVGVSFAFFNYTRTGGVNTVTTGTIHFNSSQSQLNISNAFPIAKSTAQEATTSSHDNVSVSTVTITGDTSYSGGLDFRVRATGVNLHNVPVSVLVTKTGSLSNATSEVASRSGDSIYTYDYENGTLLENSILATGHISSSTSVSETITVKAFIDDALVFITDTPSGGNYDTEQTPETGYASNENGSNASNGTTVPNGKTAVTTTTWNALATTPATFNILVESRETGTGSYMWS